MLWEIILTLCLGIFAGTITGLIPGIHINLIGAFLISLSITYLAQIPFTYLVVFITAMAITHTFVNFIPSIFLGCPDTDTELSVLPGHELLKKGFGYEAIALSTYGSLAAIFMLILIALPSILIIPQFYKLIQNLIPYFLILISLFLIFSEKQKLTALKVFLLTGTLGWIVFQLGETQILAEPLLPLLTGLFGGSMLIISIKNKIKIPEQKIKNPSTNISKPISGAFIGALLAAPLCSFLPGIGSGQAAIIGDTIIKKTTRRKSNQRAFLILLGATNTLVMGFSFISIYTISKTRTGAAVAIQQLTQNLFSVKILVLILTITFISGIISFFITLKLAKLFAKHIEKINYTKLSFITLTILLLIVLLMTKFFGVLVLIVATFTGIYCINSGVRRTNMMGCLLLPTILFYLL